MTTSLREVMSKKSDEGLMDYLTNFNKYTPDAIKAAVDELKRRGRSFSDEELNDINVNIQARVKAESEEETLWTSNQWKKSVVTDQDAPLLYSKGAIAAFSIIFSLIFGAVLLSSNINDKKKKWIVIGIGVTYTLIIVTIVNLAPSNRYWVLLLNTSGAVGLTTTFWDKYIGKETKYRAKPIWKPLIISVVVTAPFLLALILYGR